jgi:chemotaxis protein MotB
VKQGVRRRSPEEQSDLEALLAGSLEDDLRGGASADEADLDAWLLPYSDTITIMLSLFAFLVGLLEMPAPKRERIVETIRHSMDYPALLPLPEIKMELKEAERIQDPEAFVRIIKQNGLEGAITLEVSGNQAMMRFDDALLFAAGGTALSREGENVLRSFGPALADLRGTITVSGHADSSIPPGQDGAYNWRLSAERAIAVVNLLTSFRIDAARLRVQAFGDTQPVATNETPEGRRSNRRVELSVDLTR